jgi:hypothetical protein
MVRHTQMLKQTPALQLDSNHKLRAAFMVATTLNSSSAAYSGSCSTHGRLFCLLLLLSAILITACKLDASGGAGHAHRQLAGLKETLREGGEAATRTTEGNVWRDVWLAW